MIFYISEDETLESRDPDKYQTIVVPDLAVTKLKWNYVTPVIGECRLTEYTLSMQVSYDRITEIF
jgi:hypothetical protein